LEDVFLLSAVLLLPWAFGGVEIWAFRSAALLLVLGAATALARNGWAGLGLENRRSLWLLPAFLLALWAAVQIVPLPPRLLALISPGADEVYSEAFPSYRSGDGSPGGITALESRALRLVPEAEGRPLVGSQAEALPFQTPACFSAERVTISLEPSATGERLCWYLALLLAFLAIRQRLADPGRRTFYLSALTIDFTALALFGLVQAQTWDGKLYWFRPLRIASEPFGPYVNPNHFAGVMELAVPTLVALAWARWRKVGREAVYEARFVGAIVGAGICLSAGLASASKTAAVLMAASLIFLGAVGARSTRVRIILVGGIVVTILVAGGVLASSKLGGRVISYVQSADLDHLLEGRAAVWTSSTAMLVDFPFSGSGYGTFREVFPRYTPPGARARFAQAHNDYLEVLLEGGLVGFALLLWLVGAFGLQIQSRLRRVGSDRRLLLHGLLAGIAALAIHAFFDFNHQMPANALLFVTMCALLVPVSRSSDRREVTR
jgi:O-antigen ligase